MRLLPEQAEQSTPRPPEQHFDDGTMRRSLPRVSEISLKMYRKQIS
jgi:hypothetical protein